MNCKDVLKLLKIKPEFYEIINNHWENSLEDLPKSIPYFLNYDKLCEFRKYCRMDSSSDEVLKRVAEKISSNPALKLLLWHFHKSMCIYPENGNFSHWPELDATLGDDAGCFYLIGVLSIIPFVKKRYKAMNIPEEIIYDTCLQIKCFNNNYGVGHSGNLGIMLTSMNWIRHYVEARLFRLGRMEYKLQEIDNIIEVYKNKKSGNVVALMVEGFDFNQDGFVTNDKSKCVYSSVFSKDDKGVTGTIISPFGYSLNREATFLFSEWDCVLSKGDSVIDMHIPSGGGLSTDVCFDSMERAVIFFDTFFKEIKTTSIWCNSWIFNTQFEELLPNSNLTKFMRELYLFPIKSSGRAGFDFVFCREYSNLNDAPRDTSLQRAMLDTLQSGEKLRAGGMFFLKEDISAFGTQKYRCKTI